MTYTKTLSASSTATISATKARVRAVLRQVRIELMAAKNRGISMTLNIEETLNDLSYMLQKNALAHFEIRVQPGAAWRYVVSDNGTLLNRGENGGGINFYNFPRTAELSLAIRRREGLATAVSTEIDRRGWNNPVAPLTGSGQQERIYEKDGYGVTRHRFEFDQKA